MTYFLFLRHMFVNAIKQDSAQNLKVENLEIKIQYFGKQLNTLLKLKN